MYHIHMRRSQLMYGRIMQVQCGWISGSPIRSRRIQPVQKRSAREDKDERHICPLQLEVIQRCIELWTNPNDIVLDPFAGIGSVPYTAVKMGRRGIGIELKESYYKQAVNNLEIAVKGNVMECPVGQMSIEDFLTANPA